MSEYLTSVGLDIGTTSIQMVVSRLVTENQAGSFAVPEMKITEREVLYRSPVHFTPLVDESHMDGQKIRKIVEEEYRRAGIRPQDVDTGAIIVTGETSRKENAAAVAAALSEYAGDFVVVTAGPDLESVLAARGAGADLCSRDTEKTVLHMDIGGGTSNLALFREGKLLDTGCLNVGGRLVKYDGGGTVTYVSPVLDGLTPIRVGVRIREEDLEGLARMLTEVLEMAAGLREEDEKLEKLITLEGKLPERSHLDRSMVLSFSGGVADCMAQEVPWQTYGDLGPSLGRCIRQSRLCAGEYRLGRETIRATVIGAGCHSTQLSGSTVFCQNIRLPLKNLPVHREMGEAGGAIALPGMPSPSYAQVRQLAAEVAEKAGKPPLIICLEQDMAKALGQALAMILGKDAPILCIDRVKIGGNSYLDVGQPVGPALPVVVKTLIFGKDQG